ncbi:UPF0175 family protein [Methanobrevibacter smithii]|uniref:UPF0175 family protein n=1 Tax=Methanobrevibacter smithii TaxID=2173 RepID=UPI00242C9CC6|nr:UPF0175 family protein [Methanobrevibacter smithii]
MVLPKINIKEKKFQMIDNNISKQYMLLLFKALDEKPIKNKINIMKMLYFISLNVPSLENEFNFEADNYGPSSDVVERNLESLNQEDFLKEDKKGFQLNSLGKEYLNSRNFNEVDHDLIEDMKKLFNGLTSDEVCALTYFTFPETTSESVILDKIIKNRKKLALSLYKKNKISVEKASEIAGIPLKDMYQLLAKNNMKFKLSV